MTRRRCDDHADQRHGGAEPGVSATKTKAVIAARKVNCPSQLDSGLAHYTFMSNGMIYGWGRMFGRIAAADENYTLCGKITVHE
jgi:hypothetical protein